MTNAHLAIALAKPQKCIETVFLRFVHYNLIGSFYSFTNFNLIFLFVFFQSYPFIYNTQASESISIGIANGRHTLYHVSY